MVPWLIILVPTILTGVYFLEHLPRPTGQSYKQIAKGATLFGIYLFGLVSLLPPGVIYLFTLVLDFLTFPLQSGSVLVSMMHKPWQSESYAGAVYNPSDPLNVHPDWQMIWTYGHTPPSFPCPKA